MLFRLSVGIHFSSYSYQRFLGDCRYGNGECRIKLGIEALLAVTIVREGIIRDAKRDRTDLHRESIHDCLTSLERISGDRHGTKRNGTSCQRTGRLKKPA